MAWSVWWQQFLKRWQIWKWTFRFIVIHTTPHTAYLVWSRIEMFKAEEKKNPKRNEWLFRTGLCFLVCVSTGPTAPPPEGPHWTSPLSPSLFPTPPMGTSASSLVCLALGKMSWRETFSGEVMWWCCGRCGDSKLSWSQNRTCFSGRLLELAGNLACWHLPSPP